MQIRSLILDLKRRGVSQVAAIYSAAAWALLQVADVVFPLLGLPDQAISLVLLAAACGFPVALTLAWIYDLKPGTVQPDDPAAANPALTSISRLRLLEFALIVFLVGVVGALYLDRLSLLADQRKVIEKTEVSTPNSIAVLPFVSMSDLVEDAYFSDGLSEEILNLLAKMRELNVASRTASFHFRGNETDFGEIAKTLGVSHILEGSVRRNGDQLRITAQLIDTDTGYHLWSETYDREYQDIFGIQDDIAQRVASSLQGMLGEAYTPRSSSPTRNMEAYDLYLKGLNFLRRPGAEGVLENARLSFQQAIDLDPQFAAAYAGLCNTFIEFYAQSKKPDDFEAAEKYCHRTLTLDVSTSDAHIALGKLYLHSGQYVRASDEFERSIALDPLALQAYYGLADSLSARNLQPEAEAALTTAIERKPTVWRSYLEMGSLLFNAGGYETAIPFYQKAIQLVPDNQEGYNSIGSAYYMSGDYEAAATAWRRSIALSPSAFAYSNTGSSYFYLGRYDEAITMYELAVEMTPENYELWGNLAEAHSAAGHGTAAGDNYTRAMKLTQNALKVNPSDAVVTAMLAYYKASTGESAEARQSAARAQALAPDDMWVYYFTALAQCQLSHQEKALAAVTRMVELGYPSRLLAIDPGFQVLSDHPGFRELLADEVH